MAQAKPTKTLGEEEAEAAADKAADEIEARAKQAAEAAEAEKKAQETQAMTDYEKHLGRVKVTAEMTATEAWAAFYAHCRWCQRTSLEALKNEDKTREIIRHQEAIRAVDTILDVVDRPIRDLAAFIESMPLFSAGMKTRAEFDAKTGRVILRTIP